MAKDKADKRRAAERRREREAARGAERRERERLEAEARKAEGGDSATEAPGGAWEPVSGPQTLLIDNYVMEFYKHALPNNAPGVILGLGPLPESAQDRREGRGYAAEVVKGTPENLVGTQKTVFYCRWEPGGLKGIPREALDEGVMTVFMARALETRLVDYRGYRAMVAERGPLAYASRGWEDLTAVQYLPESLDVSMADE